jgi:hypothetical protein
MPRMLPMLLIAALPLSACAPAADVPKPAAAGPAAAAPGPSPATAASSVPGNVGSAPEPIRAGASISGAIREGNRPPPALRICAHPVGGSAPTCIDSPAGATSYRLDVAPGRYHLLGWVQEGELAVIAHASRIRCIRPPCPPDELIEVAVAAGEDKAGIDLSGGYLELPGGWPTRP